MKVAFTLEAVQELLTRQSCPWWIAGGWGLDLFLGETTREHDDIDISILRRDEKYFRSFLLDWELWPAIGNDGLQDKPISAEEDLPENREVLWCRPSPDADWAFELLTSPTEKEEWVFKRDDRIRKAINEIGLIADLGLPFLKPEIILLFKAKVCREKDQKDFEKVLPYLDDSSLVWLKKSLQLVHPGHPWIEKRRPGLPKGIKCL